MEFKKPHDDSIWDFGMTGPPCARPRNPASGRENPHRAPSAGRGTAEIAPQQASYCTGLRLRAATAPMIWATAARVSASRTVSRRPLRW